MTKPFVAPIGMAKFLDTVAKKTFGRTRTEAIKKGICINCGKPVADLFEDELSRVGFVLPVRIKYSKLSQRGEASMVQNKNNNSQKNSLESVVEKERMQRNKTIEKLNARILRYISDQKKLVSCLVSIRKKLSGETIPINDLITEIVKTLQEVNNNN